MRQRNEVRPTDIGRRVSFQYEAPNGYIGEVVGILELYDHAADAYVVRNKRGELVNVPLRDVRHGKVVS